jgi:putative aldouronate transport system permease protein
MTQSRSLRDPSRPIGKRIARHWQLYLVLAVPIAWLLVFQYGPMIGVQIAFKDYNLGRGIFGSPWVGLKHFKTFVSSYQFSRLLVNTVGLSFYQLLAGILPPIILALALNYSLSRAFGKVVQMVTYMPHFISTVLLVTIVTQLLSLNGVVNSVVRACGGDATLFLGKPAWFMSIYVWSGVWQNTGYNAIIYLAALAAVSPELYEAATVDGASIWRRIWSIDVPALMPTLVVLLILNVGRVLNIGFEKAFLLQNPMNLQSSDIIATYVYRVGLVSMQYSYSTAIGLLQSVVSLVLISIVNSIARKMGETSLW